MLLLLAAAQRLTAQAPIPEADPRVLALGFERARAELTLADSARARTRHLFDRSLASQAELEAAEAAREGAVLSVLERWATLTSGAPRLRIVSARKARGVDGAILVRLAIASTSAGDLAGAVVALPADVLARLRATGAGEAFVSLKDEPGPAGTAIGSPYERRIESFDAGDRVHDLEYRLLRDVDAVVVSLAAGGRVEERKVWLEADATGAVIVQGRPFSLEADLGSEATYDLTIERFGRGDEPMRLFVEGLPPEIAAVFTDQATGTRIGQLRLAPDEHQRRVRLSLVLPAGDASSLTVDSAYRFTAVAAPRGGEASGRAPRNGTTPWRSAGAGVVELELVPRGVGRGELRAVNLFHETAAGAPLSVDVGIRNAGSRSIEQLRLRSDLPPGWTLAASPGELHDVQPGGEQPVALTVTPPADTELGDYELRLSVEGTSGRTRIASDPTVLRVRIRSSRSRIAVVMLIGGTVAASAAAVAATRRLAKR